MTTLESRENIDHSFVAIVEQILDNTCKFTNLPEVYAVQIDNWFDHRWLEFDINRSDSDELGWRAKLMLPPFEPSRVVSQLSFQKHSDRGDSILFMMLPATLLREFAPRC